MKKDKLIKILIVFIIISIFLLGIIKKTKKIDLYDDFIFFKFFNSHKLSKTKNESKIIKKTFNNQEDLMMYKLEIGYKNSNLKTINLADTINKKTLINNKIAPGVMGGFKIEILSNKKTTYQVMIESQNKKPQNLMFKIKGKKGIYKSLEKVIEELNGTIEENESKIIEIEWLWEYENFDEGNKKDTYDGMNLNEYKFNLIINGGEK